MTSTVADSLLVRKQLTIQAPVEHVFTTLTTQLDTWWPRSHHIGKSEQFTAKLEPRVGGRWFEEAPDGSVCQWGRVLVWEPPRRLVLSWDISAEWQFDASLATEVELSLTPLSDRSTRLDFEHRKLERYGEKAAAMHEVFKSEGGWTGILALFAQHAESSAR
jgi:uncharacterized protein YndB with AHSA1/START domain